MTGSSSFIRMFTVLVCLAIVPSAFGAILDFDPDNPLHNPDFEVTETGAGTVSAVAIDGNQPLFIETDDGFVLTNLRIIYVVNADDLDPVTTDHDKHLAPRRR